MRGTLARGLFAALSASALAAGALGACASPPPGDGDTTDDTDDPPPDDTTPPAPWTTEPALCPAAASDLYTTPSLPPLTPADHGAIVKCALGDLLTATAAQADMQGAGAEVNATTGVRIVRLAFRTQRSDGKDAVSTATVYLPATPRATPAPVVLVGRSTSGLADSCAPSKDTRPQANFALPFAAHGFVTIAPDFAGLGNEGVHAYLDNHEAATELFDAARAVRSLLPGSIGSPVAAIGYSQGGGVVLSAQALEHELTGARTLRAVAAIAPEWPISTRSFGYETVLRNPDNWTYLSGLTPPVVTVARHYGFAANKLGAGQAGDTFPASHRASITSAIESRCTVQLGGSLNAQQRKLGDLVDDTFRRQVLACIDGAPTGCEGIGAQFHSWLVSDFVDPDPSGAAIMIAQGLGDQVMPASTEAACVVDKLRAFGIEPSICSDATATHDTILERRIENVIAWVEATVDGVTAPACASQTMPACTN